MSMLFMIALWLGCAIPVLYYVNDRRFSVRTLLIFMTIAAVWLGLWAWLRG